MTKADIVEKIAEKLSRFTKRECDEITDLVLELMKRVLVEEGKLKIAGFGNFEVKSKKDRRGRNPQTGEEMTITARKILTYHPSAVLKNRTQRDSKAGMKFGIRTPSLSKRIAARTSVKRYVRQSLGLKAPRGWGWLTNPKKAAYNRIYNRTSVGCFVPFTIMVALMGIAVVAFARAVSS